MKKSYIFYLCAFALLIFACTRETEISPEEEIPSVDVNDARMFFEKNVAEFNQLSFLPGKENPDEHTHGPDCKHDKESETQSRFTKTSAGLPDLGLTPDWGRGIAYRKNGISVVELPVLAATTTKVDQKFINIGKPSKKTTTKVARKIIMVSVDGEKKKHMFLVTLVPDKDCEREKRNNPNEFRFLGGGKFSGLVFCSEMDGQFGEVFEYHKGKKVRSMRAIPIHIIYKNKLTVSLKNYVAVTFRNMQPSSRYGSGEIDPGCSLCSLSGRPCMIHDTHGLGEVVVTPDRCNWCGKNPCVCSSPYCISCWQNPCICGFCTQCWRSPCECYSCGFCGSRYCYGSCQNSPPSGGGWYPPDIPEEEEEEEDIPIESFDVVCNTPFPIVLGSLYQLSIKTEPENATEIVDEITFFIKRIGMSGGPTSIDENPTMARTPGEHLIIAEIRIRGRQSLMSSSGALMISHRFPNRQEVSAEFKSDMDRLWDETKSMATTSSTYEKAGVMQIDTRPHAPAMWVFKEYTSSPYSYSQDEFPAPFPTNNDDLDLGDPHSGGIWTIGYMHSHPGWDKAPFGRNVGKGPQDNDPADNIPAWVYDYTHSDSVSNKPWITPATAKTATTNIISYGGDGRSR